MKLNRDFNWKSLPFIAEKERKSFLNVSIRFCGAMNERRNKSLSRLKLISTNLNHQSNEFFTNSTLHGVRYINENGRAFGEKFMWFCCVAIGFVTALIIIDSLWEKFQTEPTITGMRMISWKSNYSFFFSLLCILVHKTIIIDWVYLFSPLSYPKDSIQNSKIKNSNFRPFLFVQLRHSMLRKSTKQLSIYRMEMMKITRSIRRSWERCQDWLTMRLWKLLKIISLWRRSKLMNCEWIHLDSLFFIYRYVARIYFSHASFAMIISPVAIIFIRHSMSAVYAFHSIHATHQKLTKSKSKDGIEINSLSLFVDILLIGLEIIIWMC